MTFTYSSFLNLFISWHLFQQGFVFDNFYNILIFHFLKHDVMQKSDLWHNFCALARYVKILTKSNCVYTNDLFFLLKLLFDIQIHVYNLYKTNRSGETGIHYSESRWGPLPYFALFWPPSIPIQKHADVKLNIPKSNFVKQTLVCIFVIFFSSMITLQT